MMMLLLGLLGRGSIRSWDEEVEEGLSGVVWA